MEPLAPVLEAMVIDQEMEPSTPVLGVKIISDQIEQPAPAPEFVSFQVDILGPNSRIHPFWSEYPNSESLKSPVAKPMPIVSEYSAVPIVGEPLSEDNMSSEIKATPPVTKPGVPIIKESPPQESIAPGTKTTLPSASHEIVTRVVTAIESEVPIVDSLLAI